MAIDFRTLSFDFPPTTGRAQRGTATAVFGSDVRRASAALRGFDLRYNNGDHHILRGLVDIDIDRTLDNTVDVGVDFLLHDSSGGIDDPYFGTVEVVVIAEVA